MTKRVTDVVLIPIDNGFKIEFTIDNGAVNKRDWVVYERHDKDSVLKSFARFVNYVYPDTKEA
jgi:NAD(P)H-nitrite reductase large subunit